MADKAQDMPCPARSNPIRPYSLPKKGTAMSSKNLSSEVSFISDPARVGAPESFFNETSALESPRLVGLMRRASELREAGVVTGGEIASARRTGTIEELVLGKSNLLPAWFLEVGARRASAVCKIETSG